ncbi:hypothetical protein [Paraliobacillus sediminis]|uniref:hypothetical protein n=1 Tax=Paraliobacillus sediminis TaxID=1885916 RepID=UPI0013C37577|nr:hypothetical protein [Paraliobacillus sediminis]
MDQAKWATLLQEQHGLKIHSEAFFASELAEAVPAEREPISLEERDINLNIKQAFINSHKKRLLNKLACRVIL